MKKIIHFFVLMFALLVGSPVIHAMNDDAKKSSDLELHERIALLEKQQHLFFEMINKTKKTAGYDDKAADFIDHIENAGKNVFAKGSKIAKKIYGVAKILSVFAALYVAHDVLKSQAGKGFDDVGLFLASHGFQFIKSFKNELAVGVGSYNLLKFSNCWVFRKNK